ncbi:MAG: hypothetical protein U1C57_00010 [Candidatus Doudnabacteria bacterium]|nr:hypothetical protein [Candidatus Doudnabacteria bacterium]
MNSGKGGYMTRLMILLFAFCCLRPAFAQGPHNSVNNCETPTIDYWSWRVVGAEPIGPPIRTVDDLKGVLEPNIENGQRLFNKPWQQAAKGLWNWTDEILLHLSMAAQQENWEKVMVAPCSMMLTDMMYGAPPAGPTTIGRAVLPDWSDGQSKMAWRYELDSISPDGRAGKLRVYFFEGCSNPAYQFVFQAETQTVITPRPPPPQPEPVAPPPLAPPPVVCQQCPPPITVVRQCPVVNIDLDASWLSRALGVFTFRNLPEFLGSIGVGAGAGAGFSHDDYKLRSAWQSGVASAGANMVANAINPDHDRAKISVSGSEVARLRRGQTMSFADGRAIWNGDMINVFVSDGSGGDRLCGSKQIDNNINFTPVPLIYKVREVGKCQVLVNGELKPCFTPPSNVNRPAEKAPFTPPPNTSRP